jgi:hypothetical protein
MKNIQSLISLLFLLIALLPSCNKNNEDAINDYLPLKVGAKYNYRYSETYGYRGSGYIKKGECNWKFISMSLTNLYQVEQSFTGYWVNYYNGNPTDSTKIENLISTLSFEVQNDGKVAFTFPVPYWGYGTVTFQRFIQSDNNDTCFSGLERGGSNWGCLRKNVGITSLHDIWSYNHGSIVDYSLIEGPTY